MSGITWQTDPDAAFAMAREHGRPVLLYWGASWCPPCNRLKADAFSRADFASLARDLVALHIDGDSPGAQALGARLGLRSYPTLVVYRPDGDEITRLPCEVSGARFVEMLRVALASRLTAAQSLGAALSHARPLSDDEWRLLAFYSWDTDEGRLLGGAGLDLAAAIAAMHGGCTLPDAALRLEWHGLHAAAQAELEPKGSDGADGGIDRHAAIARIGQALGDPDAVRAQMDIVIHYAVDLVRFLTAPQSGERLGLTAAFARALAFIEDEQATGVADRLAALRTRVRMARLGALVAGIEQTVRGRVAAALAAANAPAGSEALRHQVINTAAGMLAEAGLPGDAEELLADALERSHAPYYFMHSLAALAKKRGDAPAMLDWYARAWEASVGPATRLQWGATYLQALLAGGPATGPAGAAQLERIARLAGALCAQLDGMANAASGRNGAQRLRMAAALAAWSATGAPATMQTAALSVALGR